MATVSPRGSSVRALALALLACPMGVCAETVDDLGLWFAAFGNGEIESKTDEPSPYRWWFDAHLRYRDDTDGFNQSILRPGLGVEVAENQTLWAGYAWIATQPELGEQFDEHRLWQQWIATPTAGEWHFVHRSRLEERWFEEGGDVALRWRQLARAQRAISACPEWSLIGWDEVFFHLNDAERGIETGFDQNRAFLGFGYRRCPHAPIRTEIGYLNQFVNARGGDDDMNHILSVNFFF
jgi:hypothetical protein